MPPGNTHIPRKRFGQHFLHDPTVIQKIIAAIQPLPDQRLVEIGPGQGALTIPLLRAVNTLDAIELDRDLIAPLEQKCRDIGSLNVYCNDALKFDFCQLQCGADRLRIIGNLPYNISTPLIFHLLHQTACIADMHFMLQREVVDRLVAAPGGGAYGRLSVMVQYRCAANMLFVIGPGAFTPPPRVESALVRLMPWQNPPVTVHDEQLFATVVRQAFSQRRKTLRNSLRQLLTEQDIRSLGIDPQRRAETLSLNDFALLTNAIDAGQHG